MKAKKKSFRSTELSAILQGTFPNFIVRLESIPDDDDAIGVSVFNVPSNMISAVEERIADIDEKLRGSGPLVLIPLVRDDATTAKYYPQFSGVSSLWNCSIAPADIDESVLKMDFATVRFDLPRQEGMSCELAANHELALAA